MAKSILKFLLILLLIAGLAYSALVGVQFGDTKVIPSVFDKEDGIKRGLDLVGGSVITFEAQITDELSSDEIKSNMNAVVGMLQQRLTDLNFTEATVALMNDTMVRVEIPSVTNPEEAVKKLGSTAELQFVDADGTVILKGTDVKAASAEYGQLDDLGTTGNYVSLEFTEEGTKLFSEATKRISGLSDGKNYIQILLDGESISVASVTKQIDSSTAMITGNFDAEETSWLANLINSGKLPFSLKEIELHSVGPTLGEKSLETSLLAGAIGVALVMLFMLIIYRISGLVACLALSVYIGLVAVILSIAGVNLSLPGIAGIVLSIGMAVDANVIIFERIKEELRVGKTVQASIKAGFHRAFTAIIDSNVTTIIAAIVLKIFGTGPIVGFADTLLIGVLTSMFTAILVSQFMLKALPAMKIRNIKAYGA